MKAKDTLLLNNTITQNRQFSEKSLVLASCITYVIKLSNFRGIMFFFLMNTIQISTHI